MDNREYRCHTIKIDKEEQENDIIESLHNILEAEEYTEEFTEEKENIISNVLYAVNYSLTGGSGDSFYYPEFKDHVKYISTLFPEIEFTAGWTNPENEDDKEEFTIKNNDVIGCQEIDKAEAFQEKVYKQALSEYNRLEKEFEVIDKTNPDSDEWATLQDAMIIYSNIINKLRR